MSSIDLRELNRVCRLDGKRKKLVPFQPFHMKLIQRNEFDIYIEKIMPNWNDYLLSYANNGLTFTGLVDGKVYAIFGLILYPIPGLAEAWLVSDKDLGRETVAFQRAITRFFPFIAKKKQLRRIQVIIRTSHVRFLRWIKRVGFVEEGVMRNYAPDGSSFTLFARLF
tara:strand:- start:1443 stop:1943 length:501 start_codon:yes stop_codon:yes gene_type:complete